MNYTQIHATIGKGFADKTIETVFSVGEMQYSRQDFINLIGCANFIAAAKLAKVLRRLRIQTIDQLAKYDPYSLHRTKGIGDAALYVAMCLLEFGGYDAVSWWGKDVEEKHKAIRRAKQRKHEV